ncbi:MAG: type IX secretion system sortase PorU, partial [Saprospiraceae bacterium]
EPSFTSAGEHLLMNPTGGAIALMTTVRAVYSSSNERLTRNVLEVVYNPDQPGEYPGIAEIMRRSKNEGLDSIDVNARKFTLLGDPSMKLAIPRYDVVVTHINGNVVGGGVLDTLSALEKSSLTGLIVDDNGQVLSDFNGKIFLTVYDKVQARKTLANDEDSSERFFNVQNKQLFKGAATVIAGQWFIEFVLPKDIDFSYGSGKLSFYAQNGITDAAGYFTSFNIGGVSSGGLADDEPPVIQLYMNDDNFVSGGITDQDPDIYIVLSDDFGINVSGTGVGHDLEAVLDGDDKNSLILNDFYQAALDDYTRGEVRYPLNNIAPGKHTLKVTAWDLANNPGEAYIEFLVLDQEGGVLEHVLNYPNPFTNSTNFQFEHNRPGVEMDLQVLIYTINGRLVKTIEREGYSSDGYRIDDLPWDGLDDSGGQLAKGVYVYKIKVAYHLNGGKDIVESKAEKLVILR